jgi:hypothetical protein
VHTCLLCLSINAKKGYTCIHVVIFKYIINTIYVYIYTGIKLYFNLLYLIALEIYILLYSKAFLPGRNLRCVHTHTSHIYTLVALPLFHSSPLSECNLGNVSTLLFLKEAEPPCDAPAVLA